jgi:hypothetical protein
VRDAAAHVRIGSLAPLDATTATLVSSLTLAQSVFMPLAAAEPRRRDGSDSSAALFVEADAAWSSPEQIEVHWDQTDTPRAAVGLSIAHENRRVRRHAGPDRIRL